MEKLNINDGFVNSAISVLVLDAVCFYIVFVV